MKVRIRLAYMAGIEKVSTIILTQSFFYTILMIVDFDGDDEGELSLNDLKSDNNVKPYSTADEIVQNPYYGNDIENEASNSKCAEPIVVVTNPYYE